MEWQFGTIASRPNGYLGVTWGWADSQVVSLGGILHPWLFFFFYLGDLSSSTFLLEWANWCSWAVWACLGTPVHVRIVIPHALAPHTPTLAEDPPPHCPIPISLTSFVTSTTSQCSWPWLLVGNFPPATLKFTIAQALWAPNSLACVLVIFIPVEERKQSYAGRNSPSHLACLGEGPFEGFNFHHKFSFKVCLFICSDWAVLLHLQWVLNIPRQIPALRGFIFKTMLFLLKENHKNSN